MCTPIPQSLDGNEVEEMLWSQRDQGLDPGYVHVKKNNKHVIWSTHLTSVRVLFLIRKIGITITTSYVCCEH